MYKINQKEFNIILNSLKINDNGILKELNDSIKEYIKEMVNKNIENITINYIGEEGSKESTLQSFLEVLENYNFSEYELQKIKKSNNRFTLDVDDDYIIELVINSSFPEK